MPTYISNSDDVIDSRDVISRIEELESEREDLANVLEEAETVFNEAKEDDEKNMGTLEDAVDNARGELVDWDDDNADELKALKDLQDEAEGYCPDWNYGATLIRDDYFEDYCQELVQDIGDLPHGIPNYIVIDWEATADNIKVDYTSVDFDGVTYWVR